MKFWNKQLEVRERCWTCVSLRKDDALAIHRPIQVNGAWLSDIHPVWVFRQKFRTLKHQLQTASSSGKFYMKITSSEIWFENSKDATWFILAHGTNI